MSAKNGEGSLAQAVNNIHFWGAMEMVNPAKAKRLRRIFEEIDWTK